MIEFVVVKVLWLDAESTDDWEDRLGVDRGIRPITTVGFLIEETEDRIVVAQNYDSTNDKVSMVLTIPAAWIEEFEELT